MITKSFVCRDCFGDPIYRIGTSFYLEIGDTLIPMDDKEMESILESNEHDDYPDEFYDKFAPVEELLGDTRLIY